MFSNRPVKSKIFRLIGETRKYVGMFFIPQVFFKCATLLSSQTSMFASAGSALVYTLLFPLKAKMYICICDMDSMLHLKPFNNVTVSLMISLESNYYL